MYGGFMIITLVMGAIGGLVGKMLQSKMTKYTQTPIQSGVSGKEVALQMLQNYGIHDVQVVEGQGFLTDHYNPQTKVVSLSPPIFQGQTVAAVAVAAHEVGHAVQHAEAYAFLKMRSAIVPLVQVSNRFQQFVLMGAFMMAGAGSALGDMAMLACIGLFSVTALFSLITLPVEFDASKRGLAYLDDTGIVQGEEYSGAKDGLKWAAMTYVAAALSAIVMVLYLVMRFAGNKRR